MAQLPIGLEENHQGVVDLVEMKAYYNRGEEGEKVEVESIPQEMLEEAQKYRQELIGKAADFDDKVGEKFLMEEEVSPEDLKRALRKGIVSLGLCPVFCGSAFKNKNIQPLIDAINTYLPHPGEKTEHALDLDKEEEKAPLSVDSSKPLVALAFKLEDGRFGQLTYMRIYQGQMQKGDFIINTSTGRKIKIPRIVRMHSDEMEDVNKAEAGDIVALFGIDCSSGDTFSDGRCNYSMESMHIPDPVMSLAIRPKEKSNTANFSKALIKFRREDPTFQVHRDEESNETIVSGMGELHLDIYVERMKREFNCEVLTGKPQVAYRETIGQEATFDYTHKKQTGGAGQFAKVEGRLVPLSPNEEKNLRICQ